MDEGQRVNYVKALARLAQIDEQLKRLDKLTDKLERGRDKYRAKQAAELHKRAHLAARQAVELPTPDLVDVRDCIGVAPLWEFLITVDDVPAAQGKRSTHYEAPRPLPMKPRPPVEAAPDPNEDFGAWARAYLEKRRRRADVLANSSHSKRGAA
jgi:hypothetical protein